MAKLTHLYQSSIGKKIAMALSGILLVGFVVVHMIGNLKVYQGAAKFDAYARFLRELGYPALGHEQGLWIARIVLLAAVGVHIVSAAQLARQSRRAVAGRYAKRNDLSFSYASRTMRWGGVILAGFVVFHLLHLTTGTVHPSFDHESAYRNVVTGFRVLARPVSLAYVLCMIPLALHLYHGVWSVTQTLDLRWPWVLRARRPAAAALAAAVFAGNVSIPLAILAGWVG